MDRNKLAFLLPIRSVLFILIFIIGSRIIGKSLSDISNWWTTIATAVNIFTIILLILLTMDKVEKKIFPAAKTKSVIIQISTVGSDFDFQEKFADIMKEYGFIVHDVNPQFHPKDNIMQLTYTVKTPDKLSAVKIAKEFSDKTENLISFTIIDK